MVTWLWFILSTVGQCVESREYWSEDVTETLISVTIMKEAEEGVDVTVLAERRAKLAKLRGEHFVHDREITSAPSVTKVDEFEHKFGAADWQKNENSRDISDHVVDHKIFYAEAKKGGERERKTSDLDFNTLVTEANRRVGRSSATVSDDLSLEDDETDDFSFASSLSSIDRTEKFNNKNGDSKSISRASTFAAHDYRSDKTVEEKRNSLDKEKSTIHYQDGQYVPSTEDLGYQSSASSPNETKRRADIIKTQADQTFAYKKQTQLLKVEKAMDPLSSSLPETYLKSVKNDLSESIRSTNSNRSKVVYDPRMFTGHAKVDPNSSRDPEKDYFDKMNQFHGKQKMSGNTWSPDIAPEIKDHAKSGLVKTTNNEASALECIDLSDPVHAENDTKHAMDILQSPALSNRTEFEDPDINGRSRKKKDLKNTSLSGVLLGMSGIGQMWGREDKEGVHCRKRREDGQILDSRVSYSSSWSGREGPPGHGEDDSCKICIHQKRTSCWTVLALLALDVFTIGLIIIMFNQMHSQPKGISSQLAQTGGVPDHDHENDSIQEPRILTKGRSLDLPIFNDTDHDFLEIEDAMKDLKDHFDKEIDELKEQLIKMRSPPSFSCHKTDSHTSETKVFYSDCSVTTPGMDRKTGIFQVKEAGVYQITFTGFFVSLKGHMVSADIYLRTGTKDEIIGRSSAKTDEDGVFGKDDDLHATTSIIIMEKLNVGDKVFVSMVISGPHGNSKMESDFSRKIHFTGLKISD